MSGAAAPRSAHIRETHQNDFQVDIEFADFKLVGDEPLALGGGHTAPSPYDYLLAALGSCTVMTMRWYARKQGWPLVHAEALITHEKKDGRDVFVKALHVEGDELTQEQRDRLLDVAAKCPIHKTLVSDILIETVWDESR